HIDFTTRLQITEAKLRAVSTTWKKVVEKIFGRDSLLLQDSLSRQVCRRNADHGQQERRAVPNDGDSRAASKQARHLFKEAVKLMPKLKQHLNVVFGHDNVDGTFG